MKKNVLLRCLLGAPVGLAISTFITILISCIIGDGIFYPVVPQLVSDCGNELNAVLLQTVCSLLYGAAWAGASFIWKIENWSILKQTLSHLLICSFATFPIAYFMRWMPHNGPGILMYFGIFFAVYLFIWITQYFSYKKQLQKMNEKVRQSSTENK